MPRVWQSFITGESKRIDVSPLPGDRLITKIENAFLQKDGSLKTRGGLLPAVGSIPKISSYHASYIYQYDFNKVAIFQFGSFISGSQLAREVRYWLVDTDVEQFIAENLRLTTNNGFYFDHFQVVSRRRTTSDASSIQFFALGAERLYELKFSSAGIGTTPLNASHPYAPSTYGNNIIFMAERASNTSVGSTFIDSKAFGTVLVFFDVRTGSSQFTTAPFSINAYERIFQTTFFAESIFLITSQGLRQINIEDEFSVTAIGATQRLVARFAGRNVPMQQLHGNYLLYAADELRVRDVSSLQAGIAFAGDFVANPFNDDFLTRNSAYFVFEDMILFVLEDKKSIKAITSFPMAERVALHSSTTFVDFAGTDRLIEGISSSTFAVNLKNTFLLTDNGDGNLELLYYNPVTSIDYDGTDALVRIETSYFAQVNSIDRMEVHIDKGDAVFTSLPTNRVFYQDDDKGVAIVAQDDTFGSMRYGGSLAISFATNVPVGVKFFMLMFSQVEE